MKKTIFPFLLSGAVLILMSTQAKAETHNAASDYLVQTGKSDYEKGQKDQAIHEFSKALILNPYNEEAKKWLKDLGLSDGIYSKEKTSLTQITELVDHARSYESKIQNLEKQKQALEDKFAQLQMERDVLDQKNHAKNQEISILQARLHAAEDLTREQKTELRNKVQSFTKVSQMQTQRQEPDAFVDGKKMVAYSQQQALAQGRLSNLVSFLEQSLTEKSLELERVNSKLVDHELKVASVQHHLLNDLDGAIELQDELLNSHAALVTKMDEIVGQKPDVDQHGSAEVRGPQVHPISTE